MVVNNLAQTHPELCKEWNSKRNGNLRPEDVTAGSSKRVWWFLPYTDPKSGKYFEFEWKTSVANRIKGTKCPYLASCPKVFTGFNDLATVYPEIAKEWHPSKNGTLKPTDIASSSSKVIWWFLPYDDPVTGKHFDFEWLSTVNNRAKGKKCPFLTNRKLWSGYNDLATLYPEIAKEWHPTKNGTLKPNNVLAKSGKKVWWFLPYDDPITGKHFDFEWQACIHNRTVHKNSAPFLCGKAICKGYNDLSTTHPQLAAEWHPTKNGSLKPTDVTAGSGKIVWWYLPYDDKRTGKHFNFEWRSGIEQRVAGNDCPFLTNKAIWKGYNDLLTTHPQLATEWHPTKNGKLKPTDITAGSNKCIWWKCKEDHSWVARPTTRAYRNYGCPYCSGSNLEKIVYEILKKYKVIYKAEKKFSNLYIKYYPFDIYSCRDNFLIELDGMQHFKSIEFFDRQIKFEERVRRDNLKNKFALENNIPILRIPYIYHPVKDKQKIESLVMDFVKTRKVPTEILDYYKRYEFSNYAEIANELNSLLMKMNVKA